jgi:PAS domain S-box-containing protein
MDIASNARARVQVRAACLFRHTLPFVRYVAAVSDMMEASMPTKPQMQLRVSAGTMDGPAAENGLRRSGIDILGAVPWGTHFCQFYETPRDLTEILVPYFKEGLEQNEFCMWVTSEPLQAEDAQAALRQAVPDLEEYLRQGQIEILDYSQWYTVSGKFDADRVLRGWIEKEQRALQRGYQGLRLTGNTFWLEKSDWSGFASYEAMVDSVIKNHRMIAICTYAVQKCNAVEVIEVVNNHQFALIKRFGQYEMMESRQRKRAEEGLQQLNRELEQRVNQRTAELRAANDSLQREIAERIRSEETTSRLAAIVESSEDAIIGRTLDGVVTSWNYAAERMYGYAALEMIGSSVGAITPPDRRNEIPEILEKIHQGLRVEHYETVRVRKDGQSIAVSLTVSPIKDRAGHVVGAATITCDITQRKRLEEELRAASLYARSLIEASLDPLVTISPEGKITDVNKATELATGVSREHLVGSDFSRYFTEPDRADRGYRRVLTDGLVRDYALTIRHVSGQTMDVLYNAVVYRNDAGQLQGVFAAARDITERKTTERRQAMTNSLLELFARKATRKEYLDSVTDVIRQWSGCRCAGIRVMDGEGNAPYESSIGFSRDFLEVEHRLCVERDNCICTRVICGDPAAQDAPAVTPAGSFRVDNVIQFVHGLSPAHWGSFRGNCARAGFASLAVVPIRYREETLGLIHLADEREGIVSAACVQFVESMTPLIGEALRRFNAEAELNKYREHLEELVTQRTEELARSNKDLEQFAYVASHDLQEPLRMVAGYLQLLSERYQGRLDEKADKFIAYAVDGAERMSGLIRDLLAYSRVNTRGEQFRETSAEEALDFALRDLTSAIAESGAVISHDPLPVVPADKTQLRQLFQNLIGNAVKFRSPDRTVEIHISARQDSGYWLFTVRDNGIGFDEKYRDKMFLIFQRLHSRGRYPGTGIGLAICRRIVERHGGSIWANGQLGQGSTFHFTIPIEGTP